MRCSPRSTAPGSSTVVRASTLYNLVLIAEQRGDAKAACRSLKDSLAIRPNNTATKAKWDDLCK